MDRKQYDTPRVSIIIINWNGKHFLQDCLASITDNTRYPNYDIIVVDNGSTDGSVCFMHSNYPSVSVIENTTNQGFARANNQAIRASDSEYLFMLNNDTEVMEGWLNESVALAQSNPKIGIVGSKLFYMDMKPQYIGGRQFSHHGVKSKRIVKWQGKHDRIKAVDKIYGAAFLAKREVFNNVGLFDENFYFYGEEGDLCYRARSVGYKVLYNPHSRVKHWAMGTASNDPYYGYFWPTVSWMRFYLLNYSLPRIFFYLLFGIPFAILDALAHRRLSLLLRAYAKNLKDIKEIWHKRKQRRTWHK